MNNPILGLLNQNRLAEQLGPVKNIFNMVRYAQNPSAAFAHILQSNPQFALLYQEASEILQQNGGDAQKAFFSKAQELGVNGNDIINNMLN